MYKKSKNLDVSYHTTDPIASTDVQPVLVLPITWTTMTIVAKSKVAQLVWMKDGGLARWCWQNKASDEYDTVLVVVHQQQWWTTINTRAIIHAILWIFQFSPRLELGKKKTFSAWRHCLFQYAWLHTGRGQRRSWVPAYSARWLWCAAT